MTTLMSALLLVVLVLPPQIPLGQRPSGEVKFTLPNPPQLVVGQEDNFSFCTGAQGVPQQECGGSFHPSTTVTGGNPPYHFQLDSGSGFPPMGMTLDKDGILRGKPRSAGTSRFRVCAVDLTGSQSCQDVTVQVAPANGGRRGGNPAKVLIPVIGGAAAAAAVAGAVAKQKTTTDCGPSPAAALAPCFSSTNRPSDCNARQTRMEQWCSCNKKTYDRGTGACR